MLFASCRVVKFDRVIVVGQDNAVSRVRVDNAIERSRHAAHVQFARLARKARAAGLAVDGPMTQSEFLGRLGVVERAAQLMAANPRQAGNIEADVQRLISPTGMGELFKVLAIRTPSLPPTVPFV